MNEWNFWSILQQIIIIAAVIMQMFVAYKIVCKAHGAEKVVRSTSIIVAILIFLGCKAFNITFADLIFIAITDASLIILVMTGTVIPILIGILVAEFTIRTVTKGNDFAVRILLLVGTFTLLQICYLNYLALTLTTLPPEKALLPNLCYSISVMLWVIFNFKDTGGESIKTRY